MALRGRDGGATAELGGEQANALRSSQGGGDKAYVLPTYIPIQDAREVDKQQNGVGVGVDGDPMFTIDGASRHAVAMLPDVAWALQERDAKGPDSDTKDGHLLASRAGVRRLTPLECERLQGFPDDWTRWTAAGKEIADSHRYRMMGNAVTVPVLEWIGRRLAAVDAL